MTIAANSNTKPIHELIEDAKAALAPPIPNATRETRGDFEDTKPWPPAEPAQEILGRLEMIDARIGNLEQRIHNEQQFAAMVESQQLVFNTAALVEQFHLAFGVPVETTPCVPADDRCALRLDLIDEEVGELRRAVGRVLEMRAAGQDVPAELYVKIAKELTDVQYVIDGTFLEFGLGAAKGHLVNAVHASNMSKLGDDGKVLKGPNYEGPEAALAEILSAACSGADAEWASEAPKNESRPEGAVSAESAGGAA